MRVHLFAIGRHTDVGNIHVLQNNQFIWECPKVMFSLKYTSRVSVSQVCMRDEATVDRPTFRNCPTLRK